MTSPRASSAPCSRRRLGQTWAGGTAASLHEAGSSRIGGDRVEATSIDGTETWAEGDTLPGVIFRDIPGPGESTACARCDVSAQGTWVNGTWTVELRRALDAQQSGFDVDFLVDQLLDRRAGQPLSVEFQ